MAKAPGKNPSRGGEQFASRGAGGQELHVLAVIVGGFFSGTPDHQDGNLRDARRQFVDEGGTGHSRQAQAYNNQSKSLLEAGFLHANEGRAGVGNTLHTGELALESRATEMSLEGVVVDEKDGCPDARFRGRRR